MIAAYRFHRMGKEAVELFNQMENEGLESNDVTFLSLLYACSHCGLKNEGIKVRVSLIICLQV
ncbi:putative tetratricopeptide-like helical domain superfamily [Helianthus anomalus]